MGYCRGLERVLTVPFIPQAKPVGWVFYSRKSLILGNIYLQPLKHIYLTEEGETGRNYYNIPYDFLYAAIVVSTDGYAFTIKDSIGELDHYTVDDQARNAMPWIPLLLLND
jgi:hypothetical protein